MKLKVSDVVNIYKPLNTSKLTKMESADKFKVLKAMRAMKPIADEWDSFITTIDSKLQGENHEDIIEKVKKWESEGENTTLTLKERSEINKYLMKLNKEKNECTKDELNKEVEIEFEKLNKSAFEKFIESNDLEVNAMLAIEAFLCE